MNISSIDVYPVTLPLKQNFSTSRGQVGNKNAGAPHVYVRIRTDEGLCGWGEARPSPRWSYETLESVVSAIRNYFAEAIEGVSIFNLEKIHTLMDQQIASGLTRGQPIAKAAIDMAVMDLIGKATKQPLSQVWFSEQKDRIALSYLISVKTEEEAIEKAEVAKVAGYTGIDLKIGFDPKRDIEIVRNVKKVHPDAFLRVDANQGYSLKEAMQVSKKLEEIGVDVLEQPLAASDLLGHAELRKYTEIPIALDESVWTPADVARAIEFRACDAIVIKVTKMGGLSKAKNCGEIAKAAGFDLLGGGLTESSLGLYASSHLFHSLNITTPVDLNGPMFLQDDPSKIKADVENGQVKLPFGNGIGWEVDLEKLRSLHTAHNKPRTITAKVFREG